MGTGDGLARSLVAHEPDRVGVEAPGEVVDRLRERVDEVRRAE